MKELVSMYISYILILLQVMVMTTAVLALCSDVYSCSCNFCLDGCCHPINNHNWSTPDCGSQKKEKEGGDIVS